MASHVVIIDSSARRHNIKTTPGKHLSDVLQEACAKLGLTADLYELKHNNKILDLSLTIRLSGLSSGAKLNLVQGSRSPSVVSVALQTPENGRLTAKVPSNTSLWHVLRTFEELDSMKPNLTQRATPQIDNSTGAGSGRLFYEMPVIRAMNRELSSFSDLQKTLAQLGLTSGTILLHLSYQNTQQPLEEAMKAITQYFQSSENLKLATEGKSDIESKTRSNLRTQTEDARMPPSQLILETTPDGPFSIDSTENTKSLTQPSHSDIPIHPTLPALSNSLPNSLPSDIVIFAPPNSSTPVAAAALHNEDDYTPTIEHAKAHQATLNRASQNKRLKSDVEIATEQRARAEKLASVHEVGVRIRFPDMTILQHVFVRGDSSSTMYMICREYMLHGDREPFCLKYTDGKGKRMTLPEGNERLIEDMEWSGNLLVFVEWEASASPAARNGPSLKQVYRAQARELKIDAMGGIIGSGDSPEVHPQETKGKQSEKGGQVGLDKESKMKKFLGGLSKKR